MSERETASGGVVRAAGAPISWGVCEVPGWGRQLDRSRVLAEMADLGLTATELGPAGFLPPSPSRCRSLLGGYGLRAVGGFVPVVLHEPRHDPLPEVRATMRAFREGDVEAVVLAAATGGEGYDAKPALDAAGWKTLLANLGRILRAAREFGRAVTLHPHVGTMVETRQEVDRVLGGSAVPLCLDTGHLLIGGTDPLDLVRAVPGRIAHVHLKDVDAALAERVRAGGLGYTRAVRDGIYRPLGEGDVDVAGIVTGLAAAGYSGWYVLEQDVVLDSEEADPARDVRASLAYLRSLA
ncbi:TIM barrel protein [Planomonospora venezuelensis]|uniref:Inosose dehydratase n=1 Tax=Planomonospora venezuelensis TaxID=1999 RepID=A0A841CXX7_PLAVE|nr:TIM barrel protein [Planomonospora venezuelensis]MBB5962811.1 inosose dehydratase [Planomonospora venezuelensis]GIM99393.1 inosose dehydratase [Planomonospora venezuelensis]